MMTQKDDQLKLLAKAFNELVVERDWDKFHSPKNLAMNLMNEASELSEFFTWISEEKSKESPPAEMKEKISEEVGDVFLTLVSFCAQLDIDIFQAAFDKLEKIKKKYPVAQFKGRDTKYSVHIAEA